MKESQFVKENSKRWGPLESTVRSLKRIGRRKKIAKNLGEDYVRLTDDLGYAQTFYRRRSIRVYLNNLTADIYRVIQSNREKKSNPIRTFWLEEVPSILYHGRKQFLLSAIIFSVAICIGVFSLEQNSGFAEDILGQGYVQMTDKNIENDDPMAVYKDSESMEMFISIGINNLQVLVMSFVLGLFFGIGTIGVLVSNGIMLGVFQYYFYQKGIFFESFLTIWQHGTIEISSIVIGGGAGLMLGSGYLFPGNYSRLLSLKLNFYRGMKLILALAPFIVAAAWIEAYITRHDDLSPALRLIFIIVNAGLIIGYFILYPWLIRKKLRRLENRPSIKSISLVDSIKEGETYNLGEVFQLALKSLSTWLSKIAFIPVILISGLLTFLALTGYIEELQIEWLQASTGIVVVDFLDVAFMAVANVFHTFALSNWENIGATILFVSIIAIVQVIHARYHYRTKSLLKTSVSGVAYILLMGLLFSPMAYGTGWLILIWAFSLPIASLGLAWSYKNDSNLAVGIGKAFAIYFNNFFKMLGWAGIAGLALLLIIVLLQGSITGAILYFLNVFLSFEDFGSSNFGAVVLTSGALLSISSTIILFQGGVNYLVDSNHELETAENLRKQIANIPPRRKRYGIDEAV